MIFTKKQIKEFLGGLMSLNCTIGVCILYILREFGIRKYL